MCLPDEGRIHPLTLLAHLAQVARQRGATLAGQATVSGMEVERGKGWRLTLANGPFVTARALIWAVGPTIRPNARLYALAFAANLPEDFPVFWDAAPYVYYDYRPGDGHMTVSGGRYGAPDATRERDAAYHARMIEATRRWLPEFVGIEPRWAWAVDLDSTADLLPHLRPLTKSAPGLAIEGLGALGVLPGMVLGQRAGTDLAQNAGGQMRVGHGCASAKPQRLYDITVSQRSASFSRDWGRFDVARFSSCLACYTLSQDRTLGS